MRISTAYILGGLVWILGGLATLIMSPRIGIGVGVTFLVCGLLIWYCFEEGIDHLRDDEDHSL